MNFQLTDDNRKLLLIIAVGVVLFYFLNSRKSTKEGYERAVTGGSYGKVQNEMLWYPYPNQPLVENGYGPRHAKYSPGDKVHSVSYVYPDYNATVNEAHGCVGMPCPPAFGGEDVMCYRCPQPKVYDSGR